MSPNQVQTVARGCLGPEVDHCVMKVPAVHIHSVNRHAPIDENRDMLAGLSPHEEATHTESLLDGVQPRGTIDVPILCLVNHQDVRFLLSDDVNDRVEAGEIQTILTAIKDVVGHGTHSERLPVGSFNRPEPAGVLFELSTLIGDRCFNDRDERSLGVDRLEPSLDRAQPAGHAGQRVSGLEDLRELVLNVFQQDAQMVVVHVNINCTTGRLNHQRKVMPTCPQTPTSSVLAAMNTRITDRASAHDTDAPAGALEPGERFSRESTRYRHVSERPPGRRRRARRRN